MSWIKRADAWPVVHRSQQRAAINHERIKRDVIVIGASAGGLEALESFFEQVPVGSGMAFVVVQHLSPDFRSLMDEILARRTQLPVRLVEDGMRVEADHIYLIPAKKEMIISQGRLLLSDRGRDQELSLPIDVFFRSLAQDCGSRAVAIVLSGGGSDGSRGICDVHDAGGLVLIQDLDSAQFDGMPRTARDAGVADAVMPPQEMPRVLLEHVRHANRPSSPPAESVQGMAAVYRMLEREFGIDFTHYKPSTVTRRIERRLQLSRMQDIDAYVERLREEREELDVLYRDLLIGVTRFFRNEEAFRVMEETSASEVAVAKAFVALREVYELDAMVAELNSLPASFPTEHWSTVHLDIRRLLDRAVRWLLSQESVSRPIAEVVAEFKPLMDPMRARLLDYLRGDDRERVAATVPLGRLATPHEVAVWATALCSHHAGYITGETLTIDGGHWLEQESYLPALQPRD